MLTRLKIIASPLRPTENQAWKVDSQSTFFCESRYINVINGAIKLLLSRAGNFTRIPFCVALPAQTHHSDSENGALDRMTESELLKITGDSSLPKNNIILENH